MPTREEVIAQAMARMEQNPEEPESPETPPEGEPSVPLSPEQEPSPDPEVELLDLGDGRSISRSRAAQLAGFEDYLQRNPAIASRLAAYIEAPSNLQSLPPAVKPPEGSGSVPPPTSRVPTLPPELEEYAPILEYMDKKFDTFSASLAQVTANAEQQRLESINTQLQSGVQAWNKTYNFSEAEVNAIMQHATDIGVMPTLVSQGLSPSDAMTRAMEMAFWDSPELRDRYLVERQTASAQRTQQEQAKQRKLSALGGNATLPSGSIAPPTEEQRRQSMISDIAAAME
jgi:hypothetical protein